MIAAASEPITYAQAIILGLIQGVTELFPISSLGHSVVLPRLLGWDIHQNDDYFITFLVATHLATAIVLFFFFLATGCGSCAGSGAASATAESARTTRTPSSAGCSSWPRSRPAFSGSCSSTSCEASSRRRNRPPLFLILNGLMLFGAEALRRRAPQTDEDDDTRIARQVGWPQAFLVGAAQALALIPGLSRSGATMSGGLLVGLSNKDAARFAFLLATPIIGAAALLKLPELFGSQGDGIRGQALVASLAAAAAAYASVRFLMRYFETNTLIPFAIWSVCFGVACSVYFF